MTFWQENFQFIKEVYEMRHTKMAEWMENVEKSISRIMADKVYTSSEFKRERDNFHVISQSYLALGIILQWFHFSKGLQYKNIKSYQSQISTNNFKKVKLKQISWVAYSLMKPFGIDVAFSLSCIQRQQAKFKWPANCFHNKSVI